VRALWTLIRIVVLLASLATLFVTVLFVSTPSGTSIDPSGAVIDAIALVVFVVIAWSLWRDRRALA
jgi:flagellar biosynthesis protein FliP